MQTHSFLDISIEQIVEGYVKKNFSPTEIAQICIREYLKYEERYQAWTCFKAESLLEQAKILERSLAQGNQPRTLEGIPVGVKDIFNTRDFPTEMGSPVWKGFTPGNDSRVVHQIGMAGGVIAGKTVTAEFAVHTLGKTLNPHNITHSPGTSSSGSAVAVALGVVPFALGTQTAGSIVRPASFCGVYGCKPSFGLVPRTGMLKTTDSLDTVGYFAAHINDLERIWNVLRVHGRDYPISDAALSDAKRQIKPHNRPWRVALARTHVFSQAPAYAQEALLTWTNKLADLPAITVDEVDLPIEMERAHDVHATIYNRCLAYYFKEEFKKSELVSPFMNHLIRAGNEISNADHQQALRDQQVMAHRMDELMQSYDVLISLSTAGVAPLRAEPEIADPALMWTMTHLPVISVPVFTSPAGLPFGMQLAARRYNDPLLFKFAAYLRSLQVIPEGANPLYKKNEQE